MGRSAVAGVQKNQAQLALASQQDRQFCGPDDACARRRPAKGQCAFALARIEQAMANKMQHVTGVAAKIGAQRLHLCRGQPHNVHQPLRR